MNNAMQAVINTFIVNLLHYVFWVALLGTMWAYVFILKPQSGSMFRYVGF